MNYAKLLECGHKHTRDFEQHESSRLEFLGDHIFNYATYDSEVSELLARHALETCIILNGRDGCYGGDNPEKHAKYIRYLTMCNTTFFDERIEWGTSIRSAWWRHEITYDSCALWDGSKQVYEELTFDQNEWKRFIDAVIAFSGLAVE